MNKYIKLLITIIIIFTWQTVVSPVYAVTIGPLQPDDESISEQTWEIDGTNWDPDGEGSNVVYTGWYGSSHNWGGARFTLDQDIPSGATINSATLQFYSQGTWDWDSANDYLRLYVTDSANAGSATSGTTRPSIGTPPGGSVTVYPTSIANGIRWPASGGLTWASSGNWATSPDIASLIQYLVNTYSGLSSGAHIVIWFAKPEEGVGDGEVAWLDREAGLTNSPKLTIDYTAGPTPTQTPTPTPTPTPAPESQLFTVSAWVNPTTSVASKAIAVKNEEIRLVTDASGNPLCQVHNGSDWQTAAASATALTTDSWQQVACTYDQEQIKVFINGQQTGSTILDHSLINNSANQWRFGSDAGGTYGDLSGNIDEYRIYNRALSPREVTQLYHYGPPPVAYYSFDENTGTSSVYDSSGNGLTGTMNGSLTEDDWIPGQYGSALDFDGVTSDSIEVSNDSSFVGETGTWAFWAYLKDPNDAGGGYSLIAYDQSPNDWNDHCAIYFASFNRIGARCRQNGEASPYRFIITTPVNTAYPNTWYHIALIQDGVAAKIYLDGILEVTSSGGNDDGAWTADINSSYNLYINKATGTGYPDAVIDDVRIYNYARTQEQIIEDMNAGHPVGGSPIGSQVGYWKFDEGYGDTAYDTSPQGNDGNIGGSDSCPGGTNCPVWSNNGKFNQALDFDGVNDIVLYSGGAILTGSENFSASVWVNWDGSDSSDQRIITNGDHDNNGWNIHVDSSDTNDLQISCLFGGNVTTNTELTPGTWQHLVVVNDSGDWKIYLDGKLIEVGGQTNCSFVTPDTRTVIGGTTTIADSFKGRIDEVKIYNVALTPDQVKLEYNQGKAAVLGSLHQDSGTTYNSAAAAFLPPGDTGSTCGSNGCGPVGYWKMDEKRDNTCSATADVCDTSGNENHGTNTNSPIWQPANHCHEGACLEFDGEDDYTNIPYSSDFDASSNFTAMFWFSPSSGWDSTATHENNAIISRSSNDIDYSSDSDWAFFLFNGNGSGDDDDGRLRFGTYGGNIQTTTASWSANQWYHIAVAYTNSTDATIYVNGVADNYNNDYAAGAIDGNADNPLEIGRGLYDYTSLYGYFPGKVDDVRFYDYARTPAQIAWDYNRGAPIGLWKLDECTGTIAYDLSLNGNGDPNGHNGTIEPGTEGNTSTGTCSSGVSTEMWNNGTTGKRGASLDFDGTDDYVTLTDNSLLDLYSDRNYSWSFWIKPAGFTEYADPWSQIESTTKHFLIYAHTTTNDSWGPVTQGVSAGWSTNGMSEDLKIHTNDNILSTSQWYQVVVTYDSTQSQSNRMKIYVNGFDQTSTSDIKSTGTITNISPSTTRLGGNTTWDEYFDGQIDDVQIYNYALTAEQVKLIYNNGAVYFGP